MQVVRCLLQPLQRSGKQLGGAAQRARCFCGGAGRLGCELLDDQNTNTLPTDELKAVSAAHGAAQRHTLRHRHAQSHQVPPRGGVVSEQLTQQVTTCALSVTRRFSGMIYQKVLNLYSQTCLPMMFHRLDTAVKMVVKKERGNGCAAPPVRPHFEVHQAVQVVVPVGEHHLAYD